MQEPQKVVRSGRVWAFLGVTFSTVSIATCLVSFPLIFHYLLALQAGVQQDVDFCRGRSRDLVKEILVLQQRGGADSDKLARAVDLLNGPYGDTLFGPASNRHIRAAPNAAKPQPKGALAADAPIVDETRSVPGTSCCTCHRGAIGAAGPLGPPGQDGTDGTDGEPGTNGPPAVINFAPDALLPKDCPCASLTGDQGAGGPKGPTGEAGKPGSLGEDGKPGENGPAGPAGTPGVPGKGGPQGPVGPDGAIIPEKNLPAGPPGTPGIEGGPGGPGPLGNAGNPGKDGPAGIQGEPGGPGKDGQTGPNGKPGPKGIDGAKGTCGHCAPARLAPGY